MASPTGVAFAAGVGSIAGAVLGALVAENFGRMSDQAKGGTVLLASAVGAGIGGALAAPKASASTTAAGMGKPLVTRGLSQLSPR